MVGADEKAARELALADAKKSACDLFHSWIFGRSDCELMKCWLVSCAGEAFAANKDASGVVVENVALIGEVEEWVSGSVGLVCIYVL